MNIKGLYLLIFLLLPVSCAGPTDSAKEARDELQAKYKFRKTTPKTFKDNLWHMSLAEYKLFLRGGDYDDEYTEGAFNKICAAKGERMPKQVVPKLDAVLDYAEDGDLEDCFNRVIIAQSAPFGSMPRGQFNATVELLFEEFEERELDIEAEYPLSRHLDLANMNKLISYRPELYFKIGYKDSFSLRGRELAQKMKVDIDEHRLDFTNIGPFYNKDQVDRHWPELSWIVKKHEGLRPWHDKLCGDKGPEEKAKKCQTMQKRFESLRELREVADTGKRHLDNKKYHYALNHGEKEPSRSIASEGGVEDEATR